MGKKMGITPLVFAKRMATGIAGSKTSNFIRKNSAKLLIIGALAITTITINSCKEKANGQQEEKQGKVEDKVLEQHDLFWKSLQPAELDLRLEEKIKKYAGSVKKEQVLHMKMGLEQAPKRYKSAKWLYEKDRRVYKAFTKKIGVYITEAYVALDYGPLLRFFKSRPNTVMKKMAAICELPAPELFQILGEFGNNDYIPLGRTRRPEKKVEIIANFENI